MPNVKLPTGVDLYYEVHGQGEALIFVPSTAYSGEVWKPSQMPLAGSLKLVFHDPRGCGRSVATQQVYTIEQMALDIVALMDHLKLPAAHLIGHSMGGRIALSLAQNFPGRVKSLIMAASGSGPAARPGSDCIPGLPHRLVLDLVEMGFEKFIRDEIVDSDTFFTREYRQRHRAKVE
jgi:pimeloyl-ACP methyl ester carboxylesterase